MQGTPPAEPSTNSPQGQLPPFPQGQTKALLLSYDDGLAQDLRLLDLLDHHGLQGTFNLNSGRLGQTAPWLADKTGHCGRYLGEDEVARVYRHHEIASHSVNHPDLTRLDDATIEREIHDDIAALGRLTGRPVTSFASPFGTLDERVVNTLRRAGVSHARSGGDSGTFALPDDPLRWRPTVHHSRALDVIEQFIRMDTRVPAVCLIWGHSWEFDLNRAGNDWHYADQLLGRLAGRDDIWYARAGDVSRWLAALPARPA